MEQMANLCDSCCFRGTQENVWRWLKYCLPIILAVAVAVIIVIAVTGFAVVHHVEANVEDARLNSFAFATTQGGGTETTASFFAYNISVALTIRNPNWAMSIKYTKPLVADFVFSDQRLYNVTVADEGHKYPPRKTEVHLLHTGGEVPSYVLGAAAVEDFKKQNATGVFNVEVRLSGEIMHQWHKRRKLGLSCPLTLQLAPPGPEVLVFHEVNCKPFKPQKIYF